VPSLSLDVYLGLMKTHGQSGPINTRTVKEQMSSYFLISIESLKVTLFNDSLSTAQIR
jgi:hypothetical protein